MKSFSEVMYYVYITCWHYFSGSLQNSAYIGIPKWQLLYILYIAQA